MSYSTVSTTGGNPSIFQDGVTDVFYDNTAFDKLQANKLIKTDSNKQLISVSESDVLDGFIASNLDANKSVVTDGDKKLVSMAYSADPTATTIVSRDSSGKSKFVSVETGNFTSSNIIDNGTNLALINMTDLVPKTDYAYNLGDSSKKWRRLYTQHLTVDDNGTYIYNSDSILPRTTLTYNLGNSSKKWNQFYTNSITDDGTSVTIDKTINCRAIIPTANNTYDLGASSYYWNSLRTKDIYLSSASNWQCVITDASNKLISRVYTENATPTTIVSRDGSGGSKFTSVETGNFTSSKIIDNGTDVTISSTTNCRNLIPSTTETYDLGSSSKTYNNLYTKYATSLHVIPSTPSLSALGYYDLAWRELHVRYIFGDHADNVTFGTGINSDSDATHDIGDPTHRFAKLYTKNISDNGTNVTIGTKFIIGNEIPSCTASIENTSGIEVLSVASTYDTSPNFIKLIEAYSRYIGGAGGTKTINGATCNLKFYVLGSGTVQSYTGSYGSISDGTKKRDVKDARDYLEDINKVRVVKYNFKDEDDIDPEDPKYLGVVAQELEEILPGLVETDPEKDLKTVKMSIFIPMLIKCVQSLTAKIEALEERLNTLENS